MQRAMKLVLSLLATGTGACIGGLYIHRYYAPQELPALTIDTTESDADDLRYKLHTGLSASEKQHLLDGNCQVITSTDALPKPIKNAFATITQNKPFDLANPGTRFNATDVIEQDLPRRRLVLAGTCGNRWFVQYERGGIGLSVMVMVLNSEANGDVHFEWGGQGIRPIANLSDLRNAIASGEFSDSDRF